MLDETGRVLGVIGGPVAQGGSRRERSLPEGCFAAVLHTSGSTGTPKPVPIAWAGLDAFTRWAIELIGLSERDRVLRVAELVFDLSWFDHLATWRAGAALCTAARRDLASGRSAADAIARLRPTVIYGVPSLFMKIDAALPAGAALPSSIRAVMYAGEPFPPRALASFAARVPEAAVFNLYGPTETNVCTYHRFDRAELDGERETPIGVACPYAECRLVDDAGRVIEGPGIGELVVSGPTTVSGGPYRTRDRVERRSDGLYYFRGRIDRMVKVRGYRVEPGEVEAALRSHPAVRQAAVVAREDARLGVVLHAYVTTDPGAAEGPPTERALRAHAAERLPPYMVPVRVVALDEMPLTTTGKIDYQTLADRGA